jgi:hypothetical protein
LPEDAKQVGDHVRIKDLDSRVSQVSNNLVVAGRLRLGLGDRRRQREGTPRSCWRRSDYGSA